MDQQGSRKLMIKMTHSNINNSILPVNQHPFLIPLIVKSVLEFCKATNQYDGKFFKSLRLVCKLWDEECSKFLRRETQIPIARLLNPYPNGLGWTWNRNTGFQHHYKCPFPTTREFENFQFTATCESFKNRNVQRWFTVMGEKAKSLHFISALTCFHQNDILANVLHKWCPNLETLHLDSIQCFKSLLYIFEGKIDGFSNFKDSPVICSNLKNLTISVESDSEYKDCKCKVGQLTNSVYIKCIQNVGKFMGKLKEAINLLPEKNPEISNVIYQLIESGVQDKVSNSVKRYPTTYFVDWGVLGHILKTAPLQKLVIKNFLNGSQTQDLILFLLSQPHKLRSTLEHLEFQNASLCQHTLKALGLLKCPLSTLRIDKIVWRSDAAKNLQDILQNCAETLINFEVGVDIIIYEANNQRFLNYLQVPFLPKLKTFTNKTIGLLHVSALEILRNAPILEKCCIDNLRCEGTNALQKFFTTRALYKFCNNLNDSSIKGHPLKHLKVKFGIESRRMNLFRKGFPNLINLELNVVNPLDLALAYPIFDGWKKLEAIHLSIGSVVALNEVAKCFGKLQCKWICNEVGSHFNMKL